MNDEVTVGRVRRRGWPHKTILTVVMVSVAPVALATACSGGSAVGPSASNTTDMTPYQKDLAFTACVRAHGVPNFPDPSSNGNFGINASTIGVSQSVLQAAQNACAYLTPNGGIASQTNQEQLVQGALKHANCMRTHGILNYPDPTISDGSVVEGNSAINRQSPQFQDAQNACLHYLANSPHSSSGVSVPQNAP